MVVGAMLRSLDAVHLATAQNLIAAGQTMSAFITYDPRLSDAADSVGLAVRAPSVR